MTKNRNGKRSAVGAELSRQPAAGSSRGSLLATLAVAAFAMLLLGSCGDDNGSSGSDGGGEGSSEISIVSISEGFAPEQTTLDPGIEVVWTNSDELVHTATSDDGSWDSGDLSPGETFATTITEPGTYGYFCTIHPSMRGEIVVTG